MLSFRMQKQKQTFNQKLSLSPQQIQFLNLLQIPIVDLDKRIEREIEENPTIEDEELEELEPEKNTPHNHYANQDNKSNYLVDNFTGNTNTLSSYLHKQLIGNDNASSTIKIVKYLIDSLDENGFLRRNIDSITNDYYLSTEIEISKNEINNAIEILQDLDPAGVGAKNLKECLLIQNRKSEFENKDLITRILNDFYNAFTNKNFEKIIKELQIGQQELAKVYKNIESLNPIPSSGFSKDKENTEYIIPDFSVKNNDGEVVVKLNTNRKRNIKLSPFYKNLIAETKDEKTKEFLKEKLEKAKWFIESLQKREDTLLNVMNAILELQEEYFISGAEKDLKPMKLADIAEKVKMDISTISRVTNSKYVETDFGNFLLKDFFSEAYKKDTGEVISTKEIKNKLQEIVNGEDKNSPYTDENLCKLLGQNEFYIARRTVAKYRDELKIPIAKIRRSL